MTYRTSKKLISLFKENQGVLKSIAPEGLKLVAEICKGM